MAHPRTPHTRGTLVGGVAAALTAVAIGVPTAVLPNAFFTRMTPARPLDYVFLALTALLVGAIAATYAAPGGTVAGRAGGMMVGGLLPFVAIGCPICNKLVVLALGVSGALRYFEPVQPLLGAASLALLGAAAWARLRSVGAGCTRCAR